VLAQGGSVSAVSSTISNNSSYGIFASGSGSLTVATSTFSNNTNGSGIIYYGSGLDFIHGGNTDSENSKGGFVVSGTISEDTTWQEDDVPYVVSGNLTIGTGNTLTLGTASPTYLASGNVVVKFKDTTSGITVNNTGSLTATTSNSINNIFFTSYKDDTIGGDTNGDGSATSPAKGDWKNIKFNSGSNGDFGYSIVKYGGYGSNPMLYNYGGEVNIATSTIALSDYYGIYNSGTTTVYDSYISENDNYGAYNTLTATSTFFAESNYWNATSGPYSLLYNPDGEGDNVGNYIDFDEWLQIMKEENLYFDYEKEDLDEDLKGIAG